MQNIQIEVRNRIARAKYGERIVSDNAGYTITFDFDEEWNDTDRTARFIFDSGYIDVPFSGDTVFVPMLPASVQEVKVGVYSGSLQTTTAATITVVPSCLGSDDTEYIPATDTGIPDAADLAEEDTLRIYDKSAGKLVKATLKKLGEAIGGEGGGGTTDHSQLINRDIADQHPISAITGLEEALTPLTGTTETLTPTQVYDAIKSGKSVVLQHTHSLLGLFIFASFNIFEGQKAVVSTSIVKDGNGYLVGSLVGSAGTDGAWVFNITKMAEADDIPVAVNNALAQAKANGDFDGADGLTPTIGDNGNWYLGDADTGKPSRGEKGDKGDKGDTGETGATGATGAAGAAGKSAYAYAQDGGYTGTEEEFAAKLTKEKFANPYALTFTGAVTGSYDGSKAVTVNIPSGGSGGGIATATKLHEITLEEEVTSISETLPFNPIDYKKIIVLCSFVTTTTNTSKVQVRVSLGGLSQWLPNWLNNNAVQKFHARFDYDIQSGLNMLTVYYSNNYNDLSGTPLNFNSPRYNYTSNDLTNTFGVETQNKYLGVGTKFEIWGIK